MESALSENINKITNNLDNFVIFEISRDDNTYKQISIEEFIEKLKSNEIKMRKKSNTIHYASLKIDTDSNEVHKDKEKIELSPTEYKLFKLFIDNKGKILTNEQIINCVWGVAYANTGMLRVAIKRLRNKIDSDSQFLQTIRGRGYTLKDI